MDEIMAQKKSGMNAYGASARKRLREWVRIFSECNSFASKMNEAMRDQMLAKCFTMDIKWQPKIVPKLFILQKKILVLIIKC